MTQHRSLLSIADEVVARAKSAGADVAEVMARQSDELSSKVRLGKAELVEEASSRGIGLRVFVGKRVASTHTSDLSEAGLARLVSDALEIVALTQEDEFAGPPEASLLSETSQHPALDLFDLNIEQINAAMALEIALAAEQSAFDFDPRIKNSEGATFGRVSSRSILATSGGFVAEQRGTYASLVVNPIVDDEGGKKRSGYYWSGRRFLEDLESAEQVGKKAAQRTLDKLGARKLSTRTAPVIFDPDAARSIVSLLAGCINGSAIWRHSSYLVDRISQPVASDLVNIVDDPLINKAPGSRPFDGEGILSRRNTVVEKGMLQTYLLDSYCARRLGGQSTASASRGSDGSVGVGTTNFILQSGAMTAEQLVQQSDGALYVTQMMGHGFNPTTGDFSRGATGFWIEKGKRQFPVSEVTISLNLDQILKRIDGVADDLEMNTSVASPTFRVSEMTIAGS